MKKKKTAMKSKSKTGKSALKRTKKSAKKAVRKPVAKKKKVLAIPKGYHSITPYLIVDQAADAITFYKKAFGAKELLRMDHPNGKVGHAELKIGDSKMMLADECPEMNAHAPKTQGGSAVSMHLYVKNVDVIVKAAVKAGAKLTRPVTDMFYGDRSGMLEDPFGHVWCVSTHIEDVTPAKVRKRAAEFYQKKMHE
ncbi:MAG TPA: VOC family protein [Gammaproteobacteria bacterium]|nr:VOC family protein [Gammaproteobacteria bacterium]